MNPTFCELCDNVTAESRKLSPTRWTCIKFPRLNGGTFVAPTKWARDEPYNLCRNINVGHCPVYTPVRTPPEQQLESLAP